MKREMLHILTCLAGLVLCLTNLPGVTAQQGSVWTDRTVSLTLNRGTRYEYLEQITGQTGYQFLYDSRLIQNDQTIRISKGEYKLQEAIAAVTGNPDLEIQLSGNHILLSAPRSLSGNAVGESHENDESPPHYTVSGVVRDRITGKPIPYCSVVLDGAGTGTVTNQEGGFVLLCPEEERQFSVHFSHIGYTSQSFELALLKEQHLQFSLDPRIIPLQEIVIRPVDPYRELREMRIKRDQNYPQSPIVMTTFYREGIEYQRKTISLSEGVFRIDHNGYRSAGKEQIHLIKMRRVTDSVRRSENLPKMKSGVSAILRLDVVNDLPNFLDPDHPGSPFDYVHASSTYLDGRRVHIIEFKQRKEITDPHFCGELYLDSENHALVEARFRINPDFVHLATPDYVERTGKGIRIQLLQAAYRVSYQRSETGLYYPRHTRGELNFRVRIKNSLFSAPLNFTFEMVNCQTETGPIPPIRKTQRLFPEKVFADTEHPYDAGFWEGFNMILPEEKLRELILSQLSEIILTGPEE